jgi:heme/copper-type cytochrome/quinol oxidase subunit 2
MKILTLVLMVIAVALIGYNATLVDFEAPFEGDSQVALILILSSLCAIVLLVILTLSKKIQKKIKKGIQ